MSSKSFIRFQAATDSERTAWEDVKNHQPGTDSFNADRWSRWLVVSQETDLALKLLRIDPQDSSTEADLPAPSAGPNMQMSLQAVVTTFKAWKTSEAHLAAAQIRLAMLTGKPSPRRALDQLDSDVTRAIAATEVCYQGMLVEIEHHHARRQARDSNHNGW